MLLPVPPTPLPPFTTSGNSSPVGTHLLSWVWIFPPWDHCLIVCVSGITACSCYLSLFVMAGGGLISIPHSLPSYEPPGTARFGETCAAQPRSGVRSWGLGSLRTFPCGSVFPGQALSQLLAISAQGSISYTVPIRWFTWFRENAGAFAELSVHGLFS